MAEDEYDSIKDNISKIAASMQLGSKKIYTRWLINPTEGILDAWLPFERGTDDKNSFIDVQQKLDNERLYDQEVQNWWTFFKTILEDQELRDKLLIEAGKIEIYISQLKKADYSKMQDISQNTERILRSTQQLADKQEDRIRRIDSEGKTAAELEKELNDLREEHRRKLEEMGAKDYLKHYTG